MTTLEILRSSSRSLACAVLATALAGCYSGLGAGGAGGDDGADDGGPGGDAGDDGDGPAPSRTPADPGAIHPFEVPGSEVELLPFHVRMTNLAAVAGVKPDHAMFGEMYARRYQLGDHDYANGVAPDLHWTPERMEMWVRGLKPVCDDVAFQARYPNLVSDPTPLVRAAFARDPNAEELAALQDVKTGQPDASGQYRMVCLAVLTSLDFVAR